MEEDSRERGEGKQLDMGSQKPMAYFGRGLICFKTRRGLNKYYSISIEKHCLSMCWSMQVIIVAPFYPNNIFLIQERVGVDDNPLENFSLFWQGNFSYGSETFSNRFVMPYKRFGMLTMCP